MEPESSRAMAASDALKQKTRPRVEQEIKSRFRLLKIKVPLKPATEAIESGLDSKLFPNSIT